MLSTCYSDVKMSHLMMCLNTDFGSTFSGVLTDEHGRVQAIWGSFSTQVYTSYSPLAGMLLDTFHWEEVYKGKICKK